MLKKIASIDPALLLITALALLLRCVGPGLKQINWDEINLLFWSHRIIAYGDWLWLSHNRPTGALLVAHSPLNNYLPALLYLFTNNPEILRLVVGLTGAAAGVILYSALKRYFGWGAAVIGGLLFAISAPAIDLSRLVFHPSFSIPTIALWLLTGLIGYHEGKRWAQIAHWVCLGLSIQFQPANALLGLLSLALLASHALYHRLRRRLIFTTLAAGLLTALLFVPWGIGWVQAVVNQNIPEPQHESPEIYDLSDAFNKYATGVAGRDLWLHNSDEGDWWLPDFGRDLLGVQTGLSLVSAAALLVIGVRGQREGLPYLLVGGLGLIGLLVFPLVPGRGRINDFYFMFSIIGACAVLGVTLAWLARGSWWRKLAAVALVTAFVVSGLWLTYSRTRWLEVFGWQQHMRAPMMTYTRLLDEWTAASADVAILIEPLAQVEATPTQQVYTWTVLTAPYAAVRLIDRATGQGLPLRDSGTLLVGLYGSPTLAALPGSPTPVGALATTGEPVFETLRLDPAALLPVDYAPETISRFAVGAHLLGVSAPDAPQPGEIWQARLIWRTEVPTISEDYHFSLRLTDTAGTVYAQQDFPALSPFLWEDDETVVNFAALPLPDALPDAADLRLQVWMYAYRSGETVAAVDDAGNAVAPYITHVRAD